MDGFQGARMFVQTVLHDENGNVTSVGDVCGNLGLAAGKEVWAHMMIGQATGAASGGFIYVCAGSGASGTPVITVDDDRLGGTLASHATAHEYIANGTRKTLLSAITTGTPVTYADWTRSDTTIGGINFNWLLQGYVIYGPGDSNGTAGGVPFRRYGLNQVSACPGSATGLSGILLNEVSDSTTNLVTNTNSLTVNILLRI